MTHYHIDTIPVWDALHKNDECLLCLLRRKTEHTLVERFLGASVMAPDTRIQVNEKGFCPAHHKMLYEKQNRLGHALMILSHLKQTQAAMKSLLIDMESPPAGGSFLSRMKRGPDGQKAQPLRVLADTCILCENLDETMRRYAFTLLHLWKTDSGFRQGFVKSKGVCLPDASLLLEMANKHMNGKSLQDFRRLMANLLKENMLRLWGELEWFTLKFDYRNSDAPWHDSRDALERTITKLRGWSVGTDPGLD
jgi:Family of unknown function (DUF6062)